MNAARRLQPVQRPTVPRGHQTAFSLTGYSGGGRKMIEDYEASSEERRKQLVAPRPYALSLQHKHIPEMQKVTGLATAPFFEPVVSSFYRGMLVSVPLYARLLDKPRSATELHALLAAHYEGERFVHVMPFGGDSHLDGGQLDATLCNHTNRLEIFVFGNDSQALLVARLDNLGKGASGSAVQNLNLMLGADEALGLTWKRPTRRYRGAGDAQPRPRCASTGRSADRASCVRSVGATTG